MDFKQNKQAFLDFIFLGIVVIAAFCLKSFYATCQTGDLKLFLKPVSVLVSFFSGAAYQFREEAGYFFPALNISIERSCSGINFFIMAFCMASISVLPFYQRFYQKIIVVLLSTISAFLFTILATSSRIIIAINSLHLSEFYPVLGSDKMHMMQGSFIYVFFLMLFYFLTNYSNKKISQIYA